MSVDGFLAACSKLLKGTLRVYTTSSESSGLSLDTPGWSDTHTHTHKAITFLTSPTCKQLVSVYPHYYFRHLLVQQAAILTGYTKTKIGYWWEPLQLGYTWAGGVVQTFLSSFFLLGLPSARLASSSEELKSEELDEHSSTMRSFFPFTRILPLRSCAHNQHITQKIYGQLVWNLRYTSEYFWHCLLLLKWLMLLLLGLLTT